MAQFRNLPGAGCGRQRDKSTAHVHESLIEIETIGEGFAFAAMSNETSTKSGAIVVILAVEYASSYEKTAIATDPETDFEN
ncbi:hypothetical protein HK405_009053, partial [Cladochytrium tenue]